MSPSAEHPPVALVGTTASGKSSLAMAAAAARPWVELVSVDSMQVYRGMDIGTAKPDATEQAAVRHHLIDVAAPDEDFSVSRFQQLARAAIADVEARGGQALLVGGTGLHLRAVIDDLDLPGRYPEVRARIEAEPDTPALHTRLTRLDPTAAARMEPGNRRRIVRALEVTEGSGRPFSSFGPGLDTYPPIRYRLIGVRLPRAVVDRRIADRYHRQVEAGFLDEIRRLAESPGGLSRTAAQALGYKELLAHVRGEQSLDAALDDAIVRTRRFARRQDRWFRRDPRIRWFDVDDPAEALPGLLEALDAEG